jgi:hypothetical protein
VSIHKYKHKYVCDWGRHQPGYKVPRARVGSGCTHKYYARLERPAGDKHSNLQTLVNYGCKVFENIAPGTNSINVILKTCIIKQ